MNRLMWIAATLVVMTSLAVGCAGNSSSQNKGSQGTAGPPKGGESPSSTGKGGIMYPPPP